MKINGKNDYFYRNCALERWNNVNNNKKDASIFSIHIYIFFFIQSIFPLLFEHYSIVNTDFFITTFMYSSLWTSKLCHSDLQSKFSCSIIKKRLSEFVTISWTKFIPNILFFSYISLTFAITNSMSYSLCLEIVTDYFNQSS